jgi:plasmid stabilization system protein ParE
MAKEVILTPLAATNYENIIDYLSAKWGLKVVNNFIERFETVCGFLAENSEIFPFVSKSKNIQKCVLTKHNVMYFVETTHAIKVLIVFDTRQEPAKLLSLI